MLIEANGQVLAFRYEHLSYYELNSSTSVRYCENSPRQPENTDRCSARDCLVAHRAESVPVSCVSADFPRCWAPRARRRGADPCGVYIRPAFSSDCGQGRGNSKSENKSRFFFSFYFLSRDDTTGKTHNVSSNMPFRAYSKGQKSHAGGM